MNKHTILVVDDEEGVRQSLRMILEQDYMLLFAQNGLEAVSLAKERKPDLVLLDIKLPKNNGLDALKEIKKFSPSIKTIMVTGYQSTDIAQETIKSGAVDYVIKPFAKDEILKKVKHALQLQDN